MNKLDERLKSINMYINNLTKLVQLHSDMVPQKVAQIEKLMGIYEMNIRELDNPLFDRILVILASD